MSGSRRDAAFHFDANRQVTAATQEPASAAGGLSDLAGQLGAAKAMEGD
jgi:hypothetical protein